MELYDAMEARRSVRDFTDEVIPEEILKRMVASAYSAPANDHLLQDGDIYTDDKGSGLAD